MGAKTYWTMKKECATCEFWSGPRHLKSDSRVVECEMMSEGQCTSPNSRSRGKMRKPGDSVGGGCYQKWSRLT